jgi:gephyrin
LLPPPPPPPQALVYPKPVVAILSTGNELQDIGAAQAHAASAAGGDDGWDFRVWDSNRPGLRAAIEGQGFEVLDLGIVGDE